MNATLLNQAAKKRPDIKWVVWTKPEFIPLFKFMGFSEFVTSEFPIAGGTPRFLKNGGLSLIKAICQLRNMRLNASIDFIGDAREALLGTLITGRGHHSPKWSKSHWMHRLIWNIHVPFVQYLKFTAQQSGMYSIVSKSLSIFTGSEISLEKSSQAVIAERPIIAFHLYPSQAFKNWADLHWQELNRLLLEKNLTPIVLCSKEDEKKARNLFSINNCSVKIVVTTSIEDLIKKIQSITLLVGVDSFLVHLAAALEKKTIIINAGNLPQWWQPPNSQSIGQSGGCAQYPCSNRPSCLGKLDESRCIKSIEPLQVMQAINPLLINAHT